LLANKYEHPGLTSAAERAFGFVLGAQRPRQKHGASLALAGGASAQASAIC